MKITEVIKECRIRAKVSRKLVAGESKDRYVLGAGNAYNESADMQEETVRGIRKEITRVRTDAKNGELSKPIRASAKAMAVALEWVLGEDQK